MELNEIKNLIKIDGGKFIIVENGEPVLMIMGFDDYKKIIGNTTKSSSEKTSPLFEKEENAEEVKTEINQKINNPNQEFSSEDNREYSETAEETSPQTEESLKIEDLPV
ncbi:MAG: hypothetical protein WBC21_01010 [Minisyncoccales bacterium]